MKTKLTIAALLLALTTASCGEALRDAAPDDIEVIEGTQWEVHKGPNLFPNVATACIEGYLVLTTTREAAPIVLGPCEQVPG